MTAVGSLAASGLARVARVPVAEDVLTRLEARVRRSTQHLPVLTYHRINRPLEPPYLDPSQISATPERFRDQVAWIARRFRVLTLDEAERGLAQGRVPPRSLLLTFDDGYDDFERWAWPALRDAALPVTLFVATGGLGARQERFWWDRLHHALKSAPPERVADIERRLGASAARRETPSPGALRTRLKALPHDQLLEVVAALERPDGAPGAPDVPPADRLPWPSLRRLQAEGVTLAPHTRSHPLLTRIDDETIEREVQGSRDDLAAQCPGSHVDAFAYPSGAHDDRVVAVLARLGVQSAFTTRRGINQLRRDDRLRLRRFNVGFRAGPGLIAGQLLAAPFIWRARPGSQAATR